MGMQIRESAPKQSQYEDNLPYYQTWEFVCFNKRLEIYTWSTST
jgi:hypothetical protein